MISSEKKNWSTPGLLTLLIACVFGAMYYASHYLTAQQTLVRRELNSATTLAPTTGKADQLVLPKNEKYVIGRNCLVYKGIDKNILVLDLYLLDMDPEQAYEKRFPKKAAKEEMVMGGDRYRLLSVNDRYLTLKIIKIASTR